MLSAVDASAASRRVEPLRCGGQLHGRVSRLEQTVRWGYPRCSKWRC
ncbi:hypothetical protein FDUTEX481_09895 [Tolypothrix sp. PCC 7601]|nr:hypothetical protein FDUTEX481_09895 [Tolypothrix sp. PCC 7601]